MIGGTLTITSDTGATLKIDVPSATATLAATGVSGPTGDRGPTGAKGDRGERGETGERGSTGETGPKGDRGDVGPTGAKGDKGDTGPAPTLVGTPNAAWNGSVPGFPTGTLHLALPPGDNTTAPTSRYAITTAGSGLAADAQAGLYVNAGNAYGTHLYLATTDVYAHGPKMGMRLDHLGNLAVLRGEMSSAGRVAAPLLNLRHVTADNRTDGDIWTTTAGMFGRINGVTQTFAMLAASNTWRAAQAIDHGRVTNQPSLTLQNMGEGTTGINMVAGSGGSMMIGDRTGSTWGIYCANRSMRFQVANAGFDASPQAYLFINSDSPGRAVMRLHQQNVATGNLLDCTISTGASVAKIDSTGKLSARGANISAPVTPVDGDIWTTADGLYVRIAGATFKANLTPA